MRLQTACLLALCVAVGLVHGDRTVLAEYDDTKYGDYDEYYDQYQYGNWYDEDYADGQDGGEEGYGDYDTYDANYPQDYYMDYDYFEDAADCEVGEDGKVSLLGLDACDLQIKGADGFLDNLKGGLDGVYSVVSCNDGRPVYKRKNSQGGDRLLWYSALYKDWDFNVGSEVVESDILGYGGDGVAEERPQFVPMDKWNLLAEHSSKNGEEMKDFVQVQLTITCADGSVTTATKREGPLLGDHPLLDDAEWEAKYAKVFNKYSKKNEPKINTMFVAVVVISGIAVVLGIPYLVYFKRHPRSKAYSLLNHGRKTLAGHKL